MSAAAILRRAHALLRPQTLTLIRPISSSRILLQEPQLQDPPPAELPAHPSEPPAHPVEPPAYPVAPLPPNPSSGSPFYHENWHAAPTAAAPTSGGAGFLVPTTPAGAARMHALSKTYDVDGLMNEFAGWMTSQRWAELKQLFEFWIRSLDAGGKLNKPDVNLYNHYLRANLMLGASPGEMLDLVAQMGDYNVTPNAASHNLVLEAMYNARESEAAKKLLERMLQTDSVPDDESYNLVVGLLFLVNDIDSALKYLDMTLKSGYMVSVSVFNECVRSCIYAGRLDTLASIIEKCKTMEQNKALCPTWSQCCVIADVALQADHNRLAYCAFEFFAKCIVRGENGTPQILYSVDEGLVVAALGTAGRTNSSTLLEAALSILRRSLRQKRAPNPETYLAKIYAYASLGNLQRAFSTLSELETVYGNSGEVDEELFSPFTFLRPLVVACCRNGFSTLDSVYAQLENLSRADPPYKSVAALNCVILGCANIWDLDRAYQTFEAIQEQIGTTPDIHSYNALMFAFGRLRKTSEAAKVLEHLVSSGVKPNATTYSLLVDAHLVNRDTKSALAVLDEMTKAGFIPSKETLRKVRRRCSRELDFESDNMIQSLSQKFNYRMGSEYRKEGLFNLQYTMEQRLFQSNSSNSRAEEGFVN